MGQYTLRADRLSGYRLLLGSTAEAGPGKSGRPDPEILRTYEKLGIPLEERKRLAGVAIDAVFDSVSVLQTFKEKLKEIGVIFCSSRKPYKSTPSLVQNYLGSVVPFTDNFLRFAECGRLHRWLVCVCAKGVPLPALSSQHIFRNQRAETVPV